MDQFIKIKTLLDTKLSVCYKRLSIGPVIHNDKTYFQIDCDRFDIQHSALYLPENINFAISKFTILLAKYIASELKNGV